MLAACRRCAARAQPAAPGRRGRPPRAFCCWHRARTFSATQAQWLGWERKRGKLQLLVARLATGEPGPFFDLGELSCTAPHTRYVLTLEQRHANCPPAACARWWSVAEHPHNRPVLDAGGRRVLRALRHPAAAPDPARCPPRVCRRPGSGWFAGQSGIDPYSAMSSDAYQDLFGEGSFTGKGLLHVATLHAVLGRAPAHGTHPQPRPARRRAGALRRGERRHPARSREPEHSDADAARQHRWMRGDWQLLPFLWAVPALAPGRHQPLEAGGQPAPLAGAAGGAGADRPGAGRPGPEPAGGPGCSR